MYFSILIYDEPNSTALRDEHRTSHLNYLKTFDEQTLFAGPFTTDDEAADLGSLRLIDLPDRLAAERHIAEEPYVISGIQRRWQIHRWMASTPNSWRDCPRIEGNMQALFYGLDLPGAREKRMEQGDAEETYLNENGDTVMVRGHLLNDKGTEPVGSLWLLDLPGLGAGRSLLENAPLYRSGIYKEVMLWRWRFGRVFDRFKI